MARRKLSTGGRIVAAGLSVGVAGALVGAMAVSDHTAGASQPATATDRGGSVASTDNGNAQPYDPYRDGNDAGGYNAGSSNSSSDATGNSQLPQPHTRSGGS